MNDELDDLLGAWALAAVDAEEGDAIDRMVGADPALAVRGAQMRHVVALLAEGDARTPPPAVRDDLLRAVRMRRQVLARPTPSGTVDVYRHQVDAFREAASAVDVGDWGRPALPYSWTVHGLVAHLLQVERYFAGQLGLGPVVDDPDRHDHLALGSAAIAQELTRRPQDTLADWIHVAARIVEVVDGLDLDVSLRFHQWPFSLRSLLVARSFELWTHADDVRRATDRPLAPPSPADLVTMSATSVSSLPLAVHAVSSSVPDCRVRIVLTGDGGGTFDVELGRGGAERASIVTDLVDWCRIASRRIAPGDLERTVDGDPGVVELVLQAAAIIAM